MPLVTSYYDKNREDVIYEVRKKIQNIAENYDQIIDHHVGCRYCEERCAYYDRVVSYLRKSVYIDKVNVKWKVSGYGGRTLKTFLDSNLMKELNCSNKFMKICVLGYMLQKNGELNNGQRQKYIAEFLKYSYKQ